MLMFRGGAVGALLVVLAGIFAMAPAAQAQAPADGVAIKADIKLSKQGDLQVAETVTVPKGGSFDMQLPLRLALGDKGGERRFKVSDISSTGPGSAKVNGDLFTVNAPPGTSSFKYTVHNTVSDAPGTQLFRYTGVLDADVASFDATLISPSYQMGIADCSVGPQSAPQKCHAQIEADGVLTMYEESLKKGDVIALTLQLPPGTVPANADISDGKSSGPFAITAPAVIAFGVLLVALIAFGGYVAWVRRQDATTLAGAEAADPVQRKGSKAQFVSPDGVLPGESGLLLKGVTGAGELAATVVDLAARRYLWIAPVSDSDWRLTRVNPADEQLRDYEREVYRAALPDGVDSVLLSELRAPGRVQAEPARAALRQDLHEHGLLADRKSRGLAFWLGAALVVVGIGATIGLALSGGYALVGMAVGIGGLALLLLPAYLPARTAAGRALAVRVRGMQRGLETLRVDQIPPAERGPVFSRALPFTVVDGRADSWIRQFRELNPGTGNEPALYWFGGFEQDPDLTRFAGHFPYFITALQGLFAAK
ncbi:DUF2207 domain-containing protein [Nocardia sp. NEAU-G5]|uniref:DUF2207 domain-containing protein n=1 Tax=Nocardia albiluteola TaxID=2842303 RepID=A0ABS6AQT2_9NOCA|nr:DUF2207 domain-containing protein [Nocardia albiluteola]MBU3060369.1 DUF2207 domain-containing protein [Nocardia albiluteola]